MNEQLILVDLSDNEIGALDKMEVHLQGLLHRAFSLFIFNDNGELLLQKRANHKYHSAGLWTNTCCSHPNFGEVTADAVNRRLQEEMGMQCANHFAFSFVYKTKFENGLTEHELDHVYIGYCNTPPVINIVEVEDYKYISIEKLMDDVETHPEDYTSWFKICLPNVLNYLKETIK